MRPATLVAGSVVCATLGAADLGVLSIVVVPRWLGPDPIVDVPKKAKPSVPLAAVDRPPGDVEPTVKAEPPAVEQPKGEPAAVGSPKAESPDVERPKVAEPEIPVKSRPAEVAVAHKPPPKTEDPDVVLELTGKSPSPTSTEPAPKADSIVVRFDLEKTDLGAEVHGQLSAFVAAARPGDRFRVEGHADSSGREEGNRYFSRERAKAVARELVRMGIAPSRISTNSYGSTRPLVSGRTAAAYERNRRVELFLERSSR